MLNIETGDTMPPRIASPHPTFTLPSTTESFEPLNTFQELDQEPATVSQSRQDYTFPEGGTRAWLVILGSFCIITGTFGLLNCVGLFQSYWQVHQLSSYSSSSIGWISAVNVFFNLILGVQIGPLFDRYGPRYLLLVGSVVYVVSLVVLGNCSTYWELMLMWGVCAGISGAFLTTTALSVIAHWFERRRGMASGIAFVGSSVGGIGFPLMLSPILKNLGWAWAMRIVALVALLFMVAGNLFIRGRLPPSKNGGAVDLRCFRDARFSWVTVGITCEFLFHMSSLKGSITDLLLGFEFVLFGSLGLIPTYALMQGFSNQTSFNAVALLNV